MEIFLFCSETIIQAIKFNSPCVFCCLRSLSVLKALPTSSRCKGYSEVSGSLGSPDEDT